MTMNRMHNATNPFQGHVRKVLCVCSAGLLRSPTTAALLTIHWGFNTRAVGTSSSHALIPVDGVHLHWADDIVVMDKGQESFIQSAMDIANTKETPVHTLNIPDSFVFFDAELVKILIPKLTEVFGPPTCRLESLPQ